MKTMRLVGLVLGMMFAMMPIAAQTAAAPAASWNALSFLEGTWEAKTGAGSATKVTGNYTFAKELKGHVLARHGSVAGCSGPETFDCEHGDLLYVFEDAPGAPLRAIYFDNEGHVLHYAVSAPAANTVVFLSEAGPGPRFRLTYHLQGGVMEGKFEMQIPGKEEWTSYLAWKGRQITAHGE